MLEETYAQEAGNQIIKKTGDRDDNCTLSMQMLQQHEQKRNTLNR
jgi:hypothetical protein